MKTLRAFFRTCFSLPAVSSASQFILPLGTCRFASPAAIAFLPNDDTLIGRQRG